MHAAPLAADPPRLQRIAVRLAARWPWLLLPQGTLPQVAVDAPLARVPGCAEWLRGVLARRGSMVPVFDVGRYFGAELQSLASSRIVIVDPDGDALALVCPELPEIVTPTGRESSPQQDEALPEAVLAFLTRDSVDGDDLIPTFDPRAWIRHASGRLSA